MSLLRIIAGVLVGLLGMGFIAWLLWRSFRRSDDPARLAFHWILTGLVVLAVVVLARTVGFGLAGAYVIPFAAVLFGIILTIIWAPRIGAALARPFTSLFDGGFEEVIPQPLYSMAEARRKQGRYKEAIALIQEQLAKFPHDIYGLNLLAQIQAADLGDVEAASVTVQRICLHPGHAPRNIANALDQLADWRLKFRHDIDGARMALEEIEERLPGTEFAHAAAQRRAHLPTLEMLEQSVERTPIKLTHYDVEFGRLKDYSDYIPKECDPELYAAELIARLEKNPDDAETREELAVVYATHYKRLDLAALEIHRLVELTPTNSRNVARWLHHLADLAIQFDGNESVAVAALSEIIERFPDLAVASLAQQRLNQLRSELRRNEKSQVVKLGSSGKMTEPTA